METVTAEGIAKTRRPAILDCRSAIYHFHIYHFFICSFLHVACAGLNAVPHLGLIVVVAWESGMLGVLTVRPGLHPTELCIRLVGADGVNEHGQPGFVGRADTAVVAGLLKGDIIVLAVTKRLTEGDRVFYYTTLAVSHWPLAIRTHAMGVRGGVFEEEGGVLLKGTATVIEVMDLHLYVRSIAERDKFLLYRIPGKRISNAKYSDE